MSEDRLEQALEAMKNENATPEQIAGARARVWEKLATQGVSACAEFQAGFREYLDGQMVGNGRLLLEDHLSRCSHCRARMAELRGERKVVALPVRRAASWPHWKAWAAAAALLVAALYLGRDRIDTMLAPGGPRATVASVHGALHRLPAGVLETGATIGDGELVRTGPGSRAVLRLADGSVVEVNERTEMFIRAAWSGQSVHLQRGDVIVEAAKQHRGQLRVLTRDSVAAVRGTVFAVSAGIGGTVVSVVEGSVAVTQPGVKVVLSPGQQSASNRALLHSVEDAVAWSPDAEKYAALLASFAKLEKDIAALPTPALRAHSRLLSYLPSNVVLYGAIPNLGGTIGQAMLLAEQQAAENPAFGEWWGSNAAKDLKGLVDRIQTVTPLLGDEIVFGFAAAGEGTKEQIPILFAEVQPGKRDALVSALDALRNEAGVVAVPYTVTNDMMVASDSETHLRWVVEHLGQGADTPFGAAIAARYERGTGWLFGADIEPATSVVADSAEAGFVGASQMRHLFVEQRNLAGVEENEVTLTFRGPRMGMASWLASSGSGGAAEYLSSDAIFALYASTREPRQLFDELTGQLTKSSSTIGDLSEAEAKLGPGFVGDLAAAFGTESAFALEGFSVAGPAWVMAALVNDATTVDNSIRKLADVFNAELSPEEQAKRIEITQETVDGRTWNILKPGQAPLSVTWTYDHGYLVAASDRAAAMRAIATRNGGSPLVWSAAFQQQFPSSAGLHPSAFAWLNTKGAFQGLEAFVSSPSIRKLMIESDPILVVFNGTTEQIHAASRTRITGLIVDAMLLESLTRSGRGGEAVLKQGMVQPGKR
jgi:hypothetical protein